MTEHARCQIFGELAGWWPMISPPERYEKEASLLCRLFAPSAPVRSVLELGCGGGHTASHLKTRFSMTLVDISEEMLSVSRKLNPECEHILGDMRDVRLGREFDAVFIHDAIMHMTSESDLRRAITTALTHCRTGGVAVFLPDTIKELYKENTHHGGTDAADGSGIRYLEWSWDPNANDSSTLSQYVFLVRDASGSIEVSHETHRFGLFSRSTWLGLMAEAGFKPDMFAEPDRSREIYFGRRLPGGRGR